MSARSAKNSSESPHTARLERLRGLLSEAGCDHLLVTNPKDVAYLTGFLGGDSYLLSGGDRKPVIVSDFRYQEELEPVAHLAEVHIRRGSFEDALAELFDGRGVAVCGLQAEHVTLAGHERFAKRLGAKKLKATTGLVGRLRLQKDETELKLIRKAIRVQEAALEAVLPTIEPGQTELEIAARLEAEMKQRGSSEPGFTTIVAAGPNGSLPHYRPAKAKVRKDRTLLIDWGAVVEGYHGDMTRTFAVGKWPKKMQEIFDIVLDAQQMAADALAPGRTTHEVDAVAREHIARHGYGDHFGHGLGHGMGLDGHEDPRMNPLYGNAVLEPGHVVTVEPGIYLPGVGGVRIEDDYVVTDRGARNLCSLPKDRQWSTLG